MSDREDWVLLQYGKASSKDKNIIPDKFFTNSIENALYYAFLSLPFTNANVNIGADNYGLDLNKRIENIVKGLLPEYIVLQMFSSDSKLVKNNYLVEYPEQTAYYIRDKNDSLRCSLEDNEIIAQVDVKCITLKWDLFNFPTRDELEVMHLRRSSHSPYSNHIIERPLIMLLEDPWRHFNKLRYQYDSRYRKRYELQYPHENLSIITPRFQFENLINNDEFLKLYKKYYSNWEKNSNKREDFIKIDSYDFPEKLANYIRGADKGPKSLIWLVKQWDFIEEILDDMVKELSKAMKGYWIWLFGFVDQESAKNFEKVYQNDWISFNGRSIWSSATRSPHENKWTDFKKGKRISEPDITGDDHPDLYWNNNTIDIASKWIYPINDYL